MRPFLVAQMDSEFDSHISAASVGATRGYVTTKSFNSWIQMWQHVEKVSSDHQILMWHKVRQHCCRMPCRMEVQQSDFSSM